MSVVSISLPPLPEFDALASIRARHSVRTFDPTRRIPADVMATIKEYVDYPSRDYVISVLENDTAANEGVRLGTYGVVKGATVYLCLSVGSSHRSIMKGAYAMERLMLYLTSIGIGTVWLGGTFKRRQFGDALAGNVPDDMMMPAVVPMGYAAPQRLMERIMKQVARSHTRQPWARLFYHSHAGKLEALDEVTAAKYKEALESVRLAPSATNTQPWRIVRDGDSMHFYMATKAREHSHEMVMRLIDMGIALCHFHLAAMQCNIEGEFVSEQPKHLPKLPSDWHYVATWR